MIEEPTRGTGSDLGLFICYRRMGTGPHARLLSEELSRHFGSERVFRDCDKLRPGADFPDAIEKAISFCDVLLPIIGPSWLSTSDADGLRRLDDPEDWVRMEIEEALEQNISIFPVLVEEADMPRARELPPSIARLARYQAFALSEKYWTYQMQALVDELRRIKPRAPLVSPDYDWPFLPPAVPPLPRPPETPQDGWWEATAAEHDRAAAVWDGVTVHQPTADATTSEEPRTEFWETLSIPTVAAQSAPMPVTPVSAQESPAPAPDVGSPAHGGQRSLRSLRPMASWLRLVCSVDAVLYLLLIGAFGSEGTPVVAFISGLFVAALFVAWLARAVANTPLDGRGGLRYGPRRAIGVWLIPVGNLWLPYQVVRDAWRANDPGSPGPVPGWLRAWWACSVVGASLLTASLFVPSDAPAVVLGDVAALAATLLTLRLVGRLTARQEARLAGVKESLSM